MPECNNCNLAARRSTGLHSWAAFVLAAVLTRTPAAPVHAPLHAGNYFTYQLMLATTDLRLHSTFDPTGNMTASQVQHEQYKAIMVSTAQANLAGGYVQLTQAEQHSWCFVALADSALRCPQDSNLFD